MITLFHIDILPAHWKYLCFTVGDDHYQYWVLPFGISSTLKVFTKTMVVFGAYLQTQGVCTFPYIDNWLLVADSKECLQTHLATTLDLLTSLGIQVNYKKS